MFGTNNISTTPHSYDYGILHETPTLAGYFSQTNDDDWKEDISQLKYIKSSPDFTFHDESPISQTFFSFVKRSFFEYILSNKDIIREIQSANLHNCGFIINHSFLLSIPEVIYGKKTISICAHLLHGVIYISFHSDYQYNNVTTLNSRTGKTQRHNKIDNNISHTVNANNKTVNPCTSENSTRNRADSHDKKENVDGEGFYGMFKLNLAHHKILYSAQALGILSENKIPNDCTKNDIIKILNENQFVLYSKQRNAEDSNSFRGFSTRYLTMKAYYGMSNLILLEFDNDCIKEYQVDDMIDIGYDMWKSNVILNFTSVLLSFIKNSFIYKLGPCCDLNKAPELKLFFKNINSSTVAESGDISSYDWVPSWYANQIKKYNKLH